MTPQLLRGIRIESKQKLSDHIYKCFVDIYKLQVIHLWKYLMRREEIDLKEIFQIGQAI